MPVTRLAADMASGGSYILLAITYGWRMAAIIIDDAMWPMSRDELERKNFQGSHPNDYCYYYY